MSRRRKAPRGVAEPLFAGYSLEAAREPVAPPAVAQEPAQAIPRVGAGPQRRQPPAVQRGPRPRAPQGPAVALRVREVLSMPARLLASLPAAFTLLCEACLGPGGSVPVLISTCAADFQLVRYPPRKPRWVTLHGAEWAALALAAELERATPAEFERWCALKQQDMSLELTPRLTLGDYVSRHDQRACTVREVLHACGARIVDVAAAAPAPQDFWEVTCG